MKRKDPHIARLRISLSADHLTYLEKLTARLGYASVARTGGELLAGVIRLMTVKAVEHCTVDDEIKLTFNAYENYECDKSNPSDM